jgi:DNA-binding transcriptional LysR family regulator
MDKWRALQYFVAAADEGSLAGAARRTGVSVPSVHKALAALERELGVGLFERSVRGLKLTASGQTYLDACRPLLAELEAADALVARGASRPSGVLVVGTHAQLAHHLLLPALPRFHAHCPEVQIDLRVIQRLGDADAAPVDVFLLHGWPEADELVHQKLGQARSVIAASPAYWALHGQPQHPRDLARHNCLALRNPAGILIDLWEFERGDEKEAVQVGGWFSTNAREATLQLALDGHGVGRFAEIALREELRSGRLVPVLADWVVQGGPPLNLLYRPNLRRTPRVRLFLDFVLALVDEVRVEDAGVLPRGRADLPRWHRRGSARASSILRWPG